MKVLVATTYYIVKKEDRFYAKTAFSSIVRRYKSYFGSLTLCLPVHDSDVFTENYEDITEIAEQVIPITREDAILHRKDSSLKKAISETDLVIARCHSNVAFLTSDIAHKMGKPVLAEVMSCAWDAYWNHGIVGKIAAPYMYLKMKNVVKSADYALYVTEKFLQKRYPCKNPSVGVSDVVIVPISEQIVQARFNRIAQMNRNNITLMTAAAVNVWYKGQHFVIRAIPKLNKMGIRVNYYCVGQGDQTYLKSLAKKYDVEEQVIFTGAISHDEIFRRLDNCDIYIQPSLQEGLPRAMVEAMSRGCPCIGARTAGIPELIPDACIVERKNIDQIAKKIVMMLDCGLNSYAEQNFAKARNFEEEVLRKKRNCYFNIIEQQCSKRK